VLGKWWFHPSSAFQFPNFASGTGFVYNPPNLKYSVPEPASVGLLLIVGAAMAMRRKRSEQLTI
jgi:hypothetical protein